MVGVDCPTLPRIVANAVPTMKPASIKLITLLILLVCSISNAQETSVENKQADDTTARVNEIAERVQLKNKQRDQLLANVRSGQSQLTAEETVELEELTTDIDRLQRTLVLSVAGESTLSTIYDKPAVETTWQEDVIDILKPLADSVKNLTRRPREIAELRTRIDAINEKERGLQLVLQKFDRLEDSPLNANARQYVGELFVGWQDDQQQLQQEHLILSSQLDDLLGENDRPFNGAVHTLKNFALGSGLTLLLCELAALFAYFTMRAGWWIFSAKIVSKNVRRKSTLFRVSNYSYHLITGLVVLLAVLVVIYTREDLFLLALAFLILAGIILNLKQFLPRYVAEARLLLNLGSVREEERVVYNGIPWQVKSINMYSVLHNPALDGIVRLPLKALDGLVSRPVKNKLWFPTKRGDQVILPDGLLGKIKYQTPDLVEVTVRGGMAQTYTTSDFYALSIINLSRDETFGVSVTFGLDYNVQSISITEVPQALQQAIAEKLEFEGFEKQIKSLMVELAAAGESSLDFLVYATVDSSIAAQYYKLHRLILQTCVEVSNKNNWTIPYNQLVVHNATATTGAMETVMAAKTDYANHQTNRTAVASLSQSSASQETR